VLLAFICTGCVSKAKATAQARAAFFAGQQAAMRQLHAGGEVTFVGEFKNPSIPWTEGLTLAQALIGANYLGATDPKAIVIIRDSQEIQVEADKLLNGQDVPLLPHDIIEVAK